VPELRNRKKKVPLDVFSEACGCSEESEVKAESLSDEST